MNITKKQLINFLLNKKTNIYLIDGWSGNSNYDFVNCGIYGIIFSVKVCENGNIEIYNYRLNESFKNKLINEFKAVTID